MTFDQAFSGHTVTLDLDEAFRRTPRSAFVPAFWTPAAGEPGWVVRRDPDPGWRAGVDGKDALVTQVDGIHADDVDTDVVTGGIPTSSSSAPPLMRLMLDALDLRRGHRVLEIDTGTGYNVGVLARALGSAAVTSIDVDPSLVARARTRLRELRLGPALLAGDGTAGHPAGAPFDRILATVAVERVPQAWLEQAAPGGRLVVPLDRGGGGGLLVALDVDGEGRGDGRFLPDYGGFMSLRARPRSSTPRLPDPSTASSRSTELAAAQVTDPRDPFEFYAALRVGGFVPVRLDLDDGGREDWLVRDDGSWACVSGGTVRQGGPDRLWDSLEDAYDEWTALGRPPRERFGLTVHGDEQVWWVGALRACEQ